MAMSIRFFAFFFAACSFSWAVDYFPIETGRSWAFTYTEFKGHSGGGITKEGRILWTIRSKEIRDPQSGSCMVKIVQKNELTRKKYRYFDAVNDYDSLFDPPRVSFDTIAFIDSANVCRDTLSGRILVHDPQKSVPGIYCIVDSSLEMWSGRLDCVIPMDTPCGFVRFAGKHPEYNYFFQNSSIGPIKFIFDSYGDFERSGGHTWVEWLAQLPTSAHFRAIGGKLPRPAAGLDMQTVYAINGEKLPGNRRRRAGISVTASGNFRVHVKKALSLP